MTRAAPRPGPAPTIRPFRRCDAAAAARLFHQAVHRGAAGHYTAEQLAAWAPAPPAEDAWADRLAATTTLVALDPGSQALIGFMSLALGRRGAGHIDLAFVHPDQIGAGVAYRLYAAVERAAAAAGCTRLTTDASLAARPFFARQGFAVERRQTPVRNGVALANFRMAKPLTGGDPGRAAQA